MVAHVCKLKTQEAEAPEHCKTDTNLGHVERPCLKKKDGRGMEERRGGKGREGEGLGVRKT